MNILDGYRDADIVRDLVVEINHAASRNYSVMEICGGQTHSIIKNGLDILLKDSVNFIHGPGCPVCVTDSAIIDFAIHLSQQKNIILCTFGDMLRVPGHTETLAQARAKGGNVKIVYSPTDAVSLAQKNPENQIVFFGVGFETTAPANALAVYQAKVRNIKNFFLLSAHVLVPPALQAILSAPNKIDAFLLAGHVCTVMGEHQYRALAQKYSIPLVVTGFEPVDILLGVKEAVELCEKYEFGVINKYPRSVTENGNSAAQRLLNDVFECTSRSWRGLGEIPLSGLKLRSEYAAFDAEKVFQWKDDTLYPETLCLSGAILCGEKKPLECPYFGKECSPMNPLGPTMVSTEGACAAYYSYRSQHSTC